MQMDAIQTDDIKVLVGTSFGPLLLVVLLLCGCCCWILEQLHVEDNLFELLQLFYLYPFLRRLSVPPIILRRTFTPKLIGIFSNE